MNFTYKISCACNVVMCFKVVWTGDKFLSVQSSRFLQFNTLFNRNKVLYPNGLLWIPLGRD